MKIIKLLVIVSILLAGTVMVQAQDTPSLAQCTEALAQLYNGSTDTQADAELLAECIRHMDASQRVIDALETPAVVGDSVCDSVVQALPDRMPLGNTRYDVSWTVQGCVAWAQRQIAGSWYQVVALGNANGWGYIPTWYSSTLGQLTYWNVMLSADGSYAAVIFTTTGGSVYAYALDQEGDYIHLPLRLNAGTLVMDGLTLGDGNRSYQLVRQEGIRFIPIN